MARDKQVKMFCKTMKIVEIKTAITARLSRRKWTHLCEMELCYTHPMQIVHFSIDICTFKYSKKVVSAVVEVLR